MNKCYCLLLLVVLFSLKIISSQKYKVRTNLEALFETTLNEQNNFGMLTLNRK